MQVGEIKSRLTVKIVMAWHGMSAEGTEEWGWGWLWPKVRAQLQTGKAWRAEHR